MNLFYFLKGSDPFSGIINVKYGIIVLAGFGRNFRAGIDCRQFCQLRVFSIFDDCPLVKNIIFVKIMALWRI